MLVTDEGDGDVFFDSVDSLSPPQEPVLTKQECGYEIWVNEPLSVKERRERFLHKMGLDDASPKICLQDKNMSYNDSSTSLGHERIRDCSGAISNACISHTEDEAWFDELKRRPQDIPDAHFQGKVYELSSSDGYREAEASGELSDLDMGKKKMKNWWRRFVNSRKGGEGNIREKLNKGSNKTRRIKVRHNKKRWMELSALYLGQEIRAHKGLIWTMKFSPNGQYLASGGEDGVVRIWRVISVDTSSTSFSAEDRILSEVKHDISCSRKRNKHSNQSFIALPNKIFQIEEPPLQEFYGHSCDVLDLAWSNSDILLSSSMDKTVRLWKIGCNQCLSVFRHNDYVTCIQFNPVDEQYFISGSIDGKVRIWGICEERVVDWADIRDVISAISYQPDGKGFVVGSLTGTCRFYVASGKHFQLEAQIPVNGKKRTSGNKITGIQFSQINHQRVMITSEDSKMRILAGIDLVQTYRGPTKSGSQMSGSFTQSGKHIISVGEDSLVYIWNFNDLGKASSKQIKSSSCEYFSVKGVTVAIPWSGTSAIGSYSCHSLPHYSSDSQHQLEAGPGIRELERFSFGSFFSIDGSCRGSMTWPEEKLPSWDLRLAEYEFDHHQLSLKDPCYETCLPETWGLSIVAAGCDGTIKTFHNFGLPIRL